MMKLCTLLALFYTGLAFPQFDLEHTYDDNIIKRIKLEIAGEKYYYLDKASWKVHFFNADHSPWKTVTIPTPFPGASIYLPDFKISNVSETDFNTDSLIEFSYSVNFQYPISSYVSGVINENGNLIFSVTDRDIKLSKIAGLPNKIFGVTRSSSSIHDTTVYGLPGFVLEHLYPNDEIGRANLEISGEKYFLLNSTTQQAEFYNANHTLWKTISTPKPSTEGFVRISAVSESMLNADPSLEFAYSYGHYVGSGFNVFTLKLINEDGFVLLSSPGFEASFNVIPGLDTKLFVKDKWVLDRDKTFVHSVPTLLHEATYTGNFVRGNFEGLGEKYYCLDYTAKINNADHSVWKTIPLTVPSGYYMDRVNHISVSVLNSDPLVEVSYTYYQQLGSPNYEMRYQSKVVNELGQELFFLDRASNLYVSSLPNCQNKLIADVQFIDTWSGSLSWEKGEVYDINLPLGLNEFEKSKIVVFPNPASSVLNIRTPQKITNAKIFTIVGTLVKEINSKVDEISVDGLSSGSYILQLTTEQRISTHKIMIVR